MERLFARIWSTSAQRLRKQPGYVALEDLRARLEAFAAFCNPDVGALSLGGSLWGAGFVGPDLLLPKEAAWSRSADLNLKLYEYLILKSTAVRELGLALAFHDRSRLWPRLAVLLEMPRINSWLDQRFPQFPGWERELLALVGDEMTPAPLRSEPLLQSWRKLLVARDLNGLEREVATIQASMRKNKRNGDVPFFLHATVPLPLRESGGGVGDIQEPGSDPKRERPTEADTQLRRRQKEVSQESEMKGATNPVLHSFEKAEALDDYDGGRRAESGDDELSQHEAALEELEMNRLSRTGETSSVYRQDSAGLSRWSSEPGPRERQPEVFVYPEWSVKEKTYWHSHCTIQSSTAVGIASIVDQRQSIEAAHGLLIEYWRRKISNQLNLPLWRHRQIDGSELDIDELVRLASEPVRANQLYVYSNKTKQNQDISIQFLIDASYSTDAWVAGHRIMDIFRDAIGISGLLLENLIGRVSVAATSSQTRRRVEYLEFKTFAEDWNHFFSRVSALRSQQYTRLGPAIRHASHLLAQEKSSFPLLVLMTDGKPTDLDPYEGRHGEEDVRMAISESEAKGIRIRTLSMSDHDPARLEYVFGSVLPLVDSASICPILFEILREGCLKSR